MRITFLSTSSLDYPSPRGRWLPLAQQLVERGHSVDLVLLHHTYDRLAPGARRLERGGVTVRYAGQMHVYGPVGRRRYFGPRELLKVSLLGAARLLAAAARLDSDALHVCKPQPINGLAGLLASAAARRPLLVDCDDYEAGGNRFGAAWQRRMVQLWEDGLPRRAAGVTVNTRFLERRCLDLGVPPARLVYVPNGIAAARLAPPDPRRVAGLRAALGLAGAPVVGYVGTLSQTTHNVGLLLDAFALLVRRRPAARLLLVGEGEDRAALELRAQELGLGGRALFVGPVPYAQVPLYLALAGCTVDPVADDPVAAGRSPLKIVESLAAGVPVVTGAVGDRAELLGPQAGLLAQPGSSAALAEALERLLDDPPGRAAMAEAARARAAELSWERLAERWLRVYDGCR
jgi:glycosyltransferase involved in cell wall biosynthesis